MTQQDSASQTHRGHSPQLPQLPKAASRASVHQMLPTPSALLAWRWRNDDDRAAGCRITFAVSNL